MPGWPYSFVAVLESGRTSWCQILDALRLGPADDVAVVTAVQVRRVVEDLIGMGCWHAGDRDIFQARPYSCPSATRRAPRNELCTLVVTAQGLDHALQDPERV
jgi:hypothetical protein